MKSVQWRKSLLFLGTIIAIAMHHTQAVAQSDVTTEELTKYAQVTAKIDSLKSGMKTKISEAVKSNELMEGGKLYNKLNKAKGDEAKIAETGASEEQLAAYAQIQEAITGFKADFKAQYTEVVKNEIGAGVYNKVKKALKADDAIKAQYETIVSSMASQQESSSIQGEQ